MASRVRDYRGRFSKNAKKANKKKVRKELKNVVSDHSYSSDGSLNVRTEQSFPGQSSWKIGRRLVEFSVLLNNLKFCESCRLGPVPLTMNNIKGELKKGLCGYLYVQCMNLECGHVNRVAYGKVHHTKKRGMPCFDVNTKLGTCKFALSFCVCR